MFVEWELLTSITWLVGIDTVLWPCVASGNFPIPLSVGSFFHLWQPQKYCDYRIDWSSSAQEGTRFIPSKQHYSHCYQQGLFLLDRYLEAGGLAGSNTILHICLYQNYNFYPTNSLLGSNPSLETMRSHSYMYVRMWYSTYKYVLDVHGSSICLFSRPVGRFGWWHRSPALSWPPK